MDADIHDHTVLSSSAFTPCAYGCRHPLSFIYFSTFIVTWEVNVTGNFKCSLIITQNVPHNQEVSFSGISVNDFIKDILLIF